MGVITRVGGGYSKAKVGGVLLMAGGLAVLLGKFLTGEVTDYNVLVNSAMPLLLGLIGYGIREAQEKK